MPNFNPKLYLVLKVERYCSLHVHHNQKHELEIVPSFVTREFTHRLVNNNILCFRLVPSVSKFLSLPSVRHFNANRAVVTKIKRNLYERTYPTVLVLENGATIDVKYSEPRMLIRYSSKFLCFPSHKYLVMTNAILFKH